MDNKASLDKLASIIKDLVSKPENEAFTNALQAYFIPPNLEKYKHLYEDIYNKQVLEKPMQQAKDFYENFKCKTPFLKKKLKDNFALMMRFYRENNFKKFLQTCFIQLDDIINYYFHNKNFRLHIQEYRQKDVAYFSKKGQMQTINLSYILFWKFNEEFTDESKFDLSLKYKITTFDKDTKWHIFLKVKAVCHYLFYNKKKTKDNLYNLYEFNDFFKKIYTIYVLKNNLHIANKENEEFEYIAIPKSIWESYKTEIKYVHTYSISSYMYILGLFQEIIDELSHYSNE